MKKLRYFLSITTFLFISLGLFSPASASSNLTITPITWNVIGLDSNNVAVGPNNFPVGARVCNSGAPVTNLTATFYWDDGNDLFSGDPYINLRAGSLSTISLTSLDTGACHDFYFEATVTRNSSAYNRTRRYHITVTADGGISLTTPRPRELFVERLISQNRNATNAIKLDGVSIPAGGSMNLMVGNTYTITLVASTATNGYEQIESFINFPNTIFKINQVATTYSANGGTDSSAADKLYANGCNWENDPNSPNYRSCLGVGKYGGNITIDYDVTIIGGGGTSQSLSTLIYDFSGSSYHYNSDFGTASRIVNIVSPATISISKRFVPDTITPGGVATLAFTLSNPSAVAVSGINFTDPLPTSPSNLVVAATPGASTTGCGTPTFNPQAGDQLLSFSNGTIAPNSTCTIKVNVTAPADGTYINTTNHLYVNDTVDTGNTATAGLTVASASACTPGITLARWTVPATATNPPDTTGGLPTTKASNVSTATASAFIPAQTSIATSFGQNDTYSWYSYGYKNNGQYLDFVIDTRRYSEVSMSFYAAKTSSGGDPTTLIVSYNNGSGITQKATYTLNSTFTQQIIDFTGLTSTGGNTTFRISASEANNDNSGAGMYIDNVSFTGCSHLPPPPTLSKSFNPSTIPVNTVSRLTFTLSNTQTGNEALTGVQFSDTLPEGLVVANPPNASTTCPGSPTWSPSAGSSSLIFGNPVGASLASGATCTAQVDVLATRAGQFENVSGYISSTQSGENKSSNGYATASLTAIAPPSIAINFSESPIFTGETSSLSFTLSNPNQLSSLSGVGFSLTLPAGLSVETASSSTCGGTLTVTAPTNSIVLSGGSLSANGSCTFNITVTGNTSGVYTAQTSVVTSIEGGNGNFDSDTLGVRDITTNISLLKQVGLSNSGPWYSFVSLTPPLPQDVYFRFTIENTGDITITNASLTDISYAGLDLSDCTSALSGGLGLYETLTCVSGAHSVTATNFYTNTAFATGDTVNSEEEDARFATAEITLAKSAAVTHFAGAGNVLQYTYTITNSGYAPLAGPVSVTDDKASDESCPPVNTQGDLDDYFDPDESLVCTASYAVQSGDVDLGYVTNEAYATVSGVNSNTDTETVSYVPMDFGDLPAMYNNTLWADDGARHTLGSLYLGTSVTAKVDGVEDTNAAGDASDNGVEFTGNWSDGYGDVSVTITGGKGCLTAWLDYWNGSAPYTPDGDFDDAGEVIINNQPVNTGTTPFSFSLPGGAANSATWFTRFRLLPDLDNDGDCSDQTPPELTGEVAGGEVEDYRITFSPTNVNLRDISAVPVAVNPLTFVLPLIVLAGFLGILKRGGRRQK